MPGISVVTSVYNCERFIGETIQSVLDQTYTDWEFILINDCSKDKSAEIIKSFKDPRIVFIDNVMNKGQCANLNYGISIAKGKYIARLDHDDLCYPDRFQKQFDYMEANENVVLLGSLLDIWQNGEVRSQEFMDASGTAEVKFSHMFFNFLMSHSSFFIRKSAMVDNDIWYDLSYKYAEDYRLLLQLLTVGDIDCLRDTLVTYRVFDEQTTAHTGDELMQNEKDMPRMAYFEATGLDSDIIKKAVYRKIKTFPEVFKLKGEMKKLAALCGLDIKYNKHNKQIFNVVYDHLLSEQEGKLVVKRQKLISRLRK